MPRQALPSKKPRVGPTNRAVKVKLKDKNLQTHMAMFSRCVPGSIAKVSPEHEGGVGLAHVVVEVDDAKAPVERAAHA